MAEREGAKMVLTKDYPRYQVAGYHKKNIHAKKTAGEQVGLKMKEKD